MKKVNVNQKAASSLQNQYTELVTKVMSLSEQEVKDYIRKTFPMFNPNHQFEFKFYDQMPNAKLVISLVYRENKSGTFYLNLSLDVPYTDIMLKHFMYCTEDFDR